MEVSEQTVEISRLMNPSDANVYGFVHGGIILSLIEEVGYIAVLKYFNKHSKIETYPLIDRIEHTDFIAPIKIGDVSIAKANVVYTSDHNIRVLVDIFSDNLGGKVVKNIQACLWYIGAKICENTKAVERSFIPQLNDHHENFEKYEQQYQENIKSREKLEISQQPLLKSFSEKESSNLDNLNTSNDLNDYVDKMNILISGTMCAHFGILKGGTLLKYMDEYGAIFASKYCHCEVVTACIETFDFLTYAKSGDVLALKARVVYTGTKSIEIEILAIRNNSFITDGMEMICRVFFTYVVINIPKDFAGILKYIPKTEEQKAAFKLAEERYKNRKSNRF